ncbi:MAG TPA: deoxynucleoside kinase [Trueperaceae bacterium]
MSYIVIEGVIGVGKTSLSKLLAETLGARLVLEVVEENPFLASFYESPERYAFQAQTFFLLSRFRQLQQLDQQPLFERHTVADYLFDKDFIFASLNLQGAEWELYRELYSHLRPRLTTPDLVVYLRADPELLLERIALRGRPFEREIEASYLRRLGEAYDQFFSQYMGPYTVVEAESVDFVTSERDRRLLLDTILQNAKAA